ncbi:TspO and MBR related proteins [Spirosomataceae bacterium TFI 002]|nr:TspO and MBR related proteins [Spirosomataceae bacterium TFI 002]
MNYKKLIASILICQAAGIIGSFFTISSIDSWYATLNKPSFNPPSWLFGPAWITLYFLMGIALYLVWNMERRDKIWKNAIAIFSVQLILNVAWSIIFFGMEQPLLAGFEIIILWVFILLTIIYFGKLNKTAAYLLVPYICWVTFASVLNWAIVTLN